MEIQPRVTAVAMFARLSRRLPLVLLLFCPFLMGQDYDATGSTRPRVAGGGAGTDYTGDANAIACWMIYTTGDKTGSVADNCPAGGTDNQAIGGGTAPDYAATPPAGSAAGQDATDFGATTEYARISDQNEFDSVNMSAGCWIKSDTSSNHTFFSKDDVAGFEMRLFTDDKSYIEYNNATEVGNTAHATGTWHHIVMRYDATGTHADAADDTIEIFLNGENDCAGGCTTSSDIAGNSENIAYAANESGSSSWDGSLMECFYMDRVLGDTEIKEIFLCGFDGTADGSTRDSTFGGATCADISTCC